MKDIEIIQRLERQLNKQFKEVPITEIQKKNIGGATLYSVYNGNIIGLQIFGLFLNRILLPITGLKHLTHLNLGLNMISDITYLKELENLKHLYLAGNPIQDLSPIQDLHEIETLWLYNCKIQDISPIRKLRKITTLELSKSPIKKLDAISDLTNLKTLRLWNCQISDISHIENMHKIEFIELTYNQVEDISALKNLTHLKNLLLQSNKVRDISALSNLENLEFLSLNSNLIEKIVPLKNMKKLKTLELKDNKIKDIDVLRTVIQNNEKDINIRIDKNPLDIPDDIKKLSNKAIIDWISTSKLYNRKKLDSIQEFYNIDDAFINPKNVVRLNLNLENGKTKLKTYGQVKLINSISKLSEIQELDLSMILSAKDKNGFLFNRRELLKEVSKLQNLQYLYLMKNLFSDNDIPIELFNLKNLKELNLYGNSMKNIPVEIKNLKNLKVLDMTGFDDKQKNEVKRLLPDVKVTDMLAF